MHHLNPEISPVLFLKLGMFSPRDIGGSPFHNHHHAESRCVHQIQKPFKLYRNFFHSEIDINVRHLSEQRCNERRLANPTCPARIQSKQIIWLKSSTLKNS
jgi:hypothetical protein